MIADRFCGAFTAEDVALALMGLRLDKQLCHVEFGGLFVIQGACIQLCTSTKVKGYLWAKVK